VAKGEDEAERLHYRVLGPLAVLRDGVPCTPGPLKHRTLLALLLLSANDPFPAHRLVGALWGARPPRSAIAALQIYISSLRRLLDPAHSAAHRDAREHPVLGTEASGYVLRVRPGQLDLDRFRTIVASGRARLARGHCHEAGEMFRRALEMWPGRALSDVERSGVLDAHLARLAQERLAVVRDHIDVVICRGQGHEVIGGLERLCADHPRYEEFHRQLMQALSRAGRRTEALDAYARAREVMVRDFGVEPGPVLRTAQHALLAGRHPYSDEHARCHAA
jgi:DNA-binding SARP family transcriptional activator